MIMFGHRCLVVCAVLPFCVFNAYSCDKNDSFDILPEVIQEPSVSDTTVIYVNPWEDPATQNPKLENTLVRFSQYAELDYIHQSAAVCGDYAFFVKICRMSICMYDLGKKTKVHTASFKPAGDNRIYHCNQSTFGTDKYDPSDPFPLLYISQRAKSENRCFVEVLRILPNYNVDHSEIVSFKVELVQEIFFPSMTISFGHLIIGFRPQVFSRALLTAIAAIMVIVATASIFISSGFKRIDVEMESCVGDSHFLPIRPFPAV